MEENFILNYIADIKDVADKAKQIERINRKLATQLGKDVATAVNVSKKALERVSFDRSFKIVADDGELKKVTGTVSKFSSTVETAGGALFKYTETIGDSDKGTKILGSSIQAVNKQADKLIGKSSQLSTNFNSIADVNRKFSGELGKFGQANAFLGTTLNQVSDSGSRTTKIFETNGW